MGYRVRTKEVENRKREGKHRLSRWAGSFKNSGCWHERYLIRYNTQSVFPN
jgi:hypothetical protein